MSVLFLHRARLTLGALFAVGAAPPAPPPRVSPWEVLAIADVEAIHASVVGLHPAMRDAANPGFPAELQKAYAEAAARAHAARTYLDWRAATQGFVLAFRDGHSIYRPLLEPSRVRWPGWSIDYRAGKWVVRRPTGVRSHSPDAPGDGAVLRACDGVPIETLLRQRLDLIEADWSKLPERIRFAHRLLIDPALDGPPPIARCTFAGAGGSAEVALDWQVELWPTLSAALSPIRRYAADDAIEARWLPGGALWLRLSGFGEEDRLGKLAADLAQQRARVDAAPYIVFDVRGNRGGSSNWGSTFGEMVWTKAAVDALGEASLGKFWRASPAAAAEVRATAMDFRRQGPAFAEVADYWDGIASLIDRAPQRDRALVSDPCCTPAPASAAKIAPDARKRRVFVLTDAGCFSSCVLVVNQLRRLGAMQIGEPTGRNAEYGEDAGPLTLPSGLARYYGPLAIIRQRADDLGAGPPDRVWKGAMDDTAGVEAWVAQLASARTPLAVAGAAR